MPALAPAPGPGITPAPAIDPPSVSFLGRSLAEYARFFALDIPALRGRDVLDVAAGASSFTAEACARRLNAVAVDPWYGCGLDALAQRVQGDHERMPAQPRAGRRTAGSERQRSRGPSKLLPSTDAAEADRRAAAQRFLADYEAHIMHNRYVTGSLPRLPFFDGTFDVVLCAHLLFTCAEHFDFEWHLAACRELVRVSADHVRIHPLCNAVGKPYPGLSRLRRELREGGIASEVHPVDYEFCAGANTMLVLGKKG